MILGTGNKRAFTLIEVLFSVVLLAIGLASVLGGYGRILDSYKRARLLTDGLTLLEEKMIDQELEIRGGHGAGGSLGGKEKLWVWSTQTKAASLEGWYEIKGEVHAEGRAGQIILYSYVRH